MVSRQFCSKEEKRNIHIIRGREVMSMRRCACFVVYTRGVSTYFATQTIKISFLLMFNSLLVQMVHICIECICARTRQRRSL
ncbi:hypothetical protein HID58_011649 [Brassica napus]|uniref:Uncharacterized protein n=1 Tax=Brassica napus TaxID=3708 RepID=A0ABQ8DYS5_BRANA|nr:hypothetical protein HID58_011649 [Brassica napus]